MHQIDLDARIHWMELYLMCPAGGVREAFSNTSSCRERLAGVRWPAGVSCPSCAAGDITYLEKRQLYLCRSCRTQFSVTAGTAAHRSRLDLRMWFIAAEEIIKAHAIGNEASALTGHDLAARYGISYAAAFRLKTRLIDELRHPGGGLIGASICTRPLPVPPDAGQTDEQRFEVLLARMLPPPSWKELLT